MSVDLSRLQFAITAMYHFIFVPLTMGLVLILAMMETVYVITGREIWKRMTQFWGLLFAINFAMGVATGITLEFQFGTNWAYYAHYVGDIFGVPLAIEGMMAFFLEGTFVGLFFFGWNRLRPKVHLLVTWMLALATNLSALWILIANGWMQNPVGSAFNPETMRMELTSLWEVFFNPVAQCKFVHTVSAGYVTGSLFVIAISAYYLLRKRNQEFAMNSIRVGVVFGFLSTICVLILGDESGYTTGLNQEMKLAAIEAEWDTQKAPANFTLIGIPDLKSRHNKYAIEIPYALGLIATRSLTTPVPGIKELVERGRERIKTGMIAYGALDRYRADKNDLEALALFTKHQKDLGYGLLLKRHTPTPHRATPAQIEQAALDTIPNVTVLFFAFRIMVVCGMFFLAFFGLALWKTLRSQPLPQWFLRLSLLALPLPWIASWSGWIVAEHGRQPWVIDEILPTYGAASSLPSSSVWMTLIGFIVFYSILACVDLFLMIKYARLGPEAAFEPHDIPETPEPEVA